MPKRYKPELDHRSLGWGSGERGDADAEVDRLVVSLRSSARSIVDAFWQCGVELEDDDLAPLLDRLQFILVKFVADCRAHPMRTARQILPAVKEIKREPQAFLDKIGNLSPEAVALVYEMYLQLFPRKSDLEAFECGLGPAPEAGDIAIAADAALVVLEQEARAQGKGRPKMKLVEELAVALGKQFRGLGGSLGRTYHRSGVERGAFLDFVEAVVGPARALVLRSGYSLTPGTLVSHAQDALGPGGT
jgi:hypothetical protein